MLYLSIEHQIFITACRTSPLRVKMLPHTPYKCLQKSMKLEQLKSQIMKLSLCLLCVCSGKTALVGGMDHTGVATWQKFQNVLRSRQMLL